MVHLARQGVYFALLVMLGGLVDASNAVRAKFNFRLQKLSLILHYYTNINSLAELDITFNYQLLPITNTKFPLVPMGVLAHRLRTLDRSLVPHRHKRKFSGARVCRVTFKHFPQPLRSHILSFGTLGQLLKIPPFSAQKSHSAGGGGGPQIFWGVGILIFLLLRSPCKIAKPYDNPFWEN